MWELLTGEEPYADLHYGAIIGNICIYKSKKILIHALGLSKDRDNI